MQNTDGDEIELKRIADRISSTAGVESRNYKQGFAEGQRFVANDADNDALEILLRAEVGDYLFAALFPWEAAKNLAADMGVEATLLFGEKCSVSNFTQSRLKGFVDGAVNLYLRLSPNTGAVSSAAGAAASLSAQSSSP